MKAPDLIGSPLDTAAVVLSQKKLNMRIIGHKDEPDLPEGTIVSQTPQAGKGIKEHQALYLVIARKPQPLQVPCLANKNSAEACRMIEAQALHPIMVPIATDYAHHECLAQYPMAPMVAPDQNVIIYTAENTKPLVMPDFKKRSLEEVISYLNLQGCSVDILHLQPPQAGHQCTNCIIVDQRPIAGSLVINTLEKPLKIQLQVNAF